MLEIVYYLIKPKQTLLELITPDLTFRVFLSNPVIWICEEAGAESLFPDEYSMGRKLFFLAELRSGLLRLDSREKFEKLLDDLMGTPPFGISVFDKWWELERIELADDFSDVFFRINLEQLELLEKTGNPRVDHWIERLKELKAKQNS
jgi:hypothetical protein